MINRFIGIGRVVRKPEVRFTNSEKAVSNFTIAVQRNFKNQSGEYEADFIQLVVWGRTAENCHQYLDKGSLVAVEGRLQISTYENSEGNTVWKSEIVADNVRFLDSKKSEQQVQQDDQGDPFQKIGKPIDLDAELDLDFLI